MSKSLPKIFRVEGWSDCLRRAPSEALARYLQRVLFAGSLVTVFANDPSGGESGGFAPGQLARLFATGFEILRDEVVEDAPDWAVDRAKLVRFVARKR